MTLLSVCASTAGGHPLGNFSVNHYAHIRTDPDSITLRYVVDMAEIPAFQEVLATTGSASDSWSEAERKAYLARTATRYRDGLLLSIDGGRVPLEVLTTSIATPEGVAGQQTLRVVADLAGSIEAWHDGARIHFEDTNHPGRTGWHELVVEAGAGVVIFDSSAFATGLSDELMHYPSEVLMAPLNERVADWSMTRGVLPTGAQPLHARPGQRAETRPGWSKRVADRVASMMVVPGLAPGMAWLGLLVACGLGGLQGFPGPQQSTNTAPMPGRAVLEALRMALARTGDVFAGALVALIASEYLVPTRLYLATSTVTGGLITAIGVYIFIQSRREAPRRESTPPAGDAFARDPTMLAVVLVGIAFHRIAYGLAIVLSCGMGLASGRVAAALLTVQLRRTLSHHTAGISRMAATTSALVITAAGVLILVAAVPSIAER